MAGTAGNREPTWRAGGLAGSQPACQTAAFYQKTGRIETNEGIKNPSRANRKGSLL